MAETDRLELEIATKIDGKDADKVKALASGIRSLNNAVKNFNTTNFAKVITKMSNSLETFSASIEKCYKGLSNIAKVMGKSDLKTLTAQMEAVTNTTASDNVSKRAEELKQLDIYKLKLGDIEKALKDEALTEEKRHSLLGQRLNLLENIRKYEVSTESGNEIIPESELNLTLDKIKLLKNQIVFIDEKIKTGNVDEERKNSLLKQRISILSQINKAQEKAKKISDLPQLGTETIDTGEMAGTGTVPKIKPTGSDTLPDSSSKKPKDDEAKKEKANLLASIKRVAVYRAIRAVLKDVAKSMQDAFSVASQQLPQFNQSFSQIKSSLAVINGSVGVLATSLLPIIGPLLKGIATVIGTISNSIAKTIAVIRGQNNYLKVNTKYWKDQKDAIQGSLLAFDTFTTLNLSDDTSGLYETENLNNVNNALNTTSLIMEGILVTAGLIFALDFSGKLKGISGLLGKIGKGLKSIPEKLNNISSAGLIMASSFAFVASIINLIDVIKNWKSESLVTKITAITAALAGLAAVVFSILAATGVGSVKVMKAISLGLTGATVLLTGVSAMKFADGGMFEGAGTMYAIAGESGAEVVAKGSQGTGVLNVEQFKTAMVQAFYEYGAARGDLSAASVTLNGEKVGKMTASSSYREMVRQGLL